MLLLATLVLAQLFLSGKGQTTISTETANTTPGGHGSLTESPTAPLLSGQNEASTEAPPTAPPPPTGQSLVVTITTPLVAAVGIVGTAVGATVTYCKKRRSVKRGLEEAGQRRRAYYQDRNSRTTRDTSTVQDTNNTTVQDATKTTVQDATNFLATV